LIVPLNALHCRAVRSAIQLEARAAHPRAGLRLRVSVEDGQMVIKPVADTAIGLEQQMCYH